MGFTDRTRCEVSIVQPNGRMLVRPEFEARISHESFQPEFWGGRASVITTGGRGHAWFISNGTDSWVLRHYCRGGLAAKLSRRFYWFRNEGAVRAFAEFRLLSTLFNAGLPVPKPVAAHYCMTFVVGYQAEILVERIPKAATLAEFLDSPDPELWYRVGKMLHQFHEFGVYHADLNCHNILVAADGLYLIDFDKGEIRPGCAEGRGWKRSNLERLHRSVKKLGKSVAEQCINDNWRELLLGYRSDIRRLRDN